MSFDWCEYLNLAQELCGQTGVSAIQDAKLRTSVSRAYYCAFCVARNYLRDVKGLPIASDVTAHQSVANWFKGRQGKRERKVGHDLDRLRIDRNKADYDDTVSGLTRMTKGALKRTQRIISTIP